MTTLDTPPDALLGVAELQIPKVPSQTNGRSDLDRALAMCAALCSDTETMRFLVIPGEPYSKSRPRFSRNGHAYVKVKDRQQEEYTGFHLRQRFAAPMTGNVALGCIFFRPNRQRIDADNMLKHVCDAANGILFEDDSQVTAIMAVVELDADNPRTVVVVGQHSTTLTRGTDAMKPCAHCGEPMVTVGQNPNKQFCSRSCSYKARGLDLSEPVPCKGCGKPFRRTTKAQSMCSPECRANHLRNRPRKPAKPMSRCSTCGKTLTHRRGGRCRECWQSNPGGEVR